MEFLLISFFVCFGMCMLRFSPAIACSTTSPYLYLYQELFVLTNWYTKETQKVEFSQNQSLKFPIRKRFVLCKSYTVSRLEESINRDQACSQG